MITSDRLGLASKVGPFFLQKQTQSALSNQYTDSPIRSLSVNDSYINLQIWNAPSVLQASAYHSKWKAKLLREQVF